MPSLSNVSGKTCTDLFDEAVAIAYHSTADPVALISWGHLIGQSEKVWLGACDAFMCRPPATDGEEFRRRAILVANIYGLQIAPLSTSRGIEYWLHRPSAHKQIEEMAEMAPNAPGTHRARGLLCGIPPSSIDTKYHQRYEDYEAGQ